MKEVIIGLRGTNEKLRRENMALKRQNSALRQVVLHQCPICRIAWCEDRERLAQSALGREWQLLQTGGDVFGG